MLNTVQIYRKENADMAEETKQTPKLELIRASEIDPKSVEWLWYPFIPYGKDTLVQGDPGDGKSTFLLTIAAMLTKGDPLPFTEPETPPEPIISIPIWISAPKRSRLWLLWGSLGKMREKKMVLEGYENDSN